MRVQANTSSRRGSALILSLIAIVTLAAMGAAFLRITTSLTSRQTDDVENMKAFYLAEAGLAEAFQGVRMGRTGQLGAEGAPAAFGDGLLWVEATETEAQQVRLESTALVGRGRATLAYVLEPVKVPLGFFGDQELVVESVLLMDGFDSSEGSYEESLLGETLVLNRNDPNLNVDPANGVVFNNGRFYRYHASEGDTFFYDHAVLYEDLAENWPYAEAYDMQEDDFTDDDGPEDFHDEEYEGVLAYFADVPFAAGVSPGETASLLGPTTGEGALLGSNGDIDFLAASAEDVQIFGDVVPGPGGSIQAPSGFDATGSTAPRLAAVELPAVETPNIALSAPVRHADLLPLLVPAGAVGYERIEVAADAELILQGPSTVVIGTLVLEPGATLSLDTRDGDVALYVTEKMDLQPGSVLSTSEDPTEATILVPEIQTDLDGAPIQLDATAQFHGTIYAPSTDVRIGGDFEIYGGVIAKRLEIGAGARLHFDNAGFEGSPIPRIVSWRIVEIPTAVRGARDPFQQLGVTGDDLAPLAEAHDLASVQLVVTYLDHGATLRQYEGREDLFDWTGVAEVIEVERNPEDDTTTGKVRTSVQFLVDQATRLGRITGGKVTVDGLLPLVPLSKEEWAAIEGVPGDMDPIQWDRLVEGDLAAGGTGGL